MGGPGSGSNQQISIRTLERRKSAIQSYVHDDMTLEQIGKRHGVTREMIRQDCNKQDRTLYLLAQRRRKARTRLRAFVNEQNGNRLFFITQCGVCGEDFEPTNNNGIYCSPLHYQISVLFRYHLYEKTRQAHKKANAKWTLANQDHDAVNEIKIRHAKRVLVEVDESRGTWFCQGSLAFHWAIRAYLLEWPLFDRLPEVLQNQVKEYFGN